ncbi:gliding motility-associated C-terminal domain-containing protein [Zobellia sp.]|nr:gliding motility-associated C-terminal domain-containing protein [Zobellia sp.]
MYFIFLLVCATSYAQDRVYADVISDSNEVDQANNAIDSDLTTNAIIRSSSGLIAGLGAYDGFLELAYPSILPANTTSFLKVETEDDILSSLSGGNLGNLLSDTTGVLLTGNQEFTAQALNEDDFVLDESSEVLNAFSSDEARVVIDENGDYFLALTPSESYDRIRLTNSVGSLVSYGETKNLDVYGAFYGIGDKPCGAPSFTSFSGDGITLDLLNLGGAGVANPEFALDGDEDTFSQLDLGLVNALASIEQTFYFDSPEDARDNYYIKLATDPSLLNSVEVVGQNGVDTPVFSENLSNLLDLDSVSLLENGEATVIGFDPDNPIDRITIRLSSLLGTVVNQDTQIYEVFRAPERPVINSSAEDLFICVGSSTTIAAGIENSSNAELRWYDAQVNGNLLSTVNSGEAFNTPILNIDTTYYVAAAEVGCVLESPRTAVEINVESIPAAADISVLGNENPICSSNNVVLVASSSVVGTFSWYFDADKTIEIIDGLVVGAVTYTIDSNGVLTITGLTEGDGPYTYYVAVKDILAGCENASGDLVSVEVNVVGFSKNVSIDSNVIISLDELVDIFNGNHSMNITGTVSGDVTAGEPISLGINGKLFDDVVKADSSFIVEVNALDVVSDIDNTIEAFVQGMFCMVSDSIPVQLPDLIIDDVFQVFCASDLPTIADLKVNRDDIIFFDDLTEGQQLTADTPLVDGQVYFAGLLDIPTSVLARVPITVQVTDVLKPTTSNTNQALCTSGDPVVGDIQTNQANVVFYDSATGGEVLDPSTPIEDSKSYYVAAVNDGCESSERLMIMTTLTNNGPSISLMGESEEVCQNRSYTYVTISGKENYIWEIVGGIITDGGTSIDDYATVSWTELSNAEISVSYDNDLGCSSTQSTSLEVDVTTCGMVLGEEFGLQVFNQFSPNNDGLNDFFSVQGIEDYKNTIEIYNRNGHLVYKMADYQNTWNGIANVKGVLNNGDNLPSGTYYYSILIPELDRNIMGWIQLAR